MAELDAPARRHRHRHLRPEARADQGSDRHGERRAHPDLMHENLIGRVPAVHRSTRPRDGPAAVRQRERIRIVRLIGARLQRPASSSPDTKLFGASRRSRLSASDTTSNRCAVAALRRRAPSYATDNCRKTAAELPGPLASFSRHASPCAWPLHCGRLDLGLRDGLAASRNPL